MLIVNAIVFAVIIATVVWIAKKHIFDRMNERLVSLQHQLVMKTSCMVGLFLLMFVAVVSLFVWLYPIALSLAPQFATDCTRYF